MPEKKGFLQQDLSIASIKGLLKKKKQDGDVEEIVSDGDTSYVEYQDPRFQSFNTSAPSVNLLPQKIVDEAGGHRTSKKMGLVTMGLVLVFGAVYGGGFLTEQAAGNKAGDIENEASTLVSEASSLMPYYQYGESVKQKRTELYTTTQGEVAYHTLAQDFSNLATSAGLQVGSLTFSTNGAGGVTAGASPDAVSGNTSASGATGATGGGGACTKPDPFTTESGAGCISFTLKGNKDNLSKFYEVADSSDKFINMYIPQSLISSEGDAEGGITGTIEYVESYSVDNNFDLNKPLDDGTETTVPGPSNGAVPGAPGSNSANMPVPGGAE